MKNKNNELNLDYHRDPILDSINEGVFTVDLDWRITSFNKAAEKITGISRKDAIGHRCNEVFKANICENACAVKAAIDTGKPAPHKTVYVIDSKGTRIPIKISAAVLRDNHNKVIGGVETFQDLRQVEELRKKLLAKHTVSDIVGKSAIMTRLFTLLPQIADSHGTVLIQGPTGTGKELFAHAIHHLSSRRKKRFVAVNCGALPDTLLESELFGYSPGAFTGANRKKPGRFALAEGGTLFLDEIGDISPAMQTCLLRVLQEKTYEPLGSVNSVRTNVRIIASSNKELKKLVQEGKFREDLYYRIHVLRIDIPPLLERKDDIPLLVNHFISANNRTYDREVAGLSPEAFMLIMNHDFPGNIRELQNVLEHSFALCHSGLIQPHHLPQYLQPNQIDNFEENNGNMKIKSVEKTLIVNALRKHNGNRELAALELGINPSTLYRKLKQYNLPIPKKDGRGNRN
ncbi:MAG: sigma 54-interacting transcriptional regulator [Deltaproteobacteria bacterium]|nr:sigma 54-interacting transcriptional regulator [Deltaproteobacteria bacterium]